MESSHNSVLLPNLHTHCLKRVCSATISLTCGPHKPAARFASCPSIKPVQSKTQANPSSPLRHLIPSSVTHLDTAMAFVSTTAAASPATLFLSVLSAPRGPGACVCPQRRQQPFSAPLHAAKGPNSAPVVLESKAKGKKKKGSGAGNLPGALDIEIREAQEYLDSDQQVTVTPSTLVLCSLNCSVPVELCGKYVPLTYQISGDFASNRIVLGRIKKEFVMETETGRWLY